MGLICQVKDRKQKRIMLALKEIRLGDTAREIREKLHFNILCSEALLL